MKCEICSYSESYDLIQDIKSSRHYESKIVCLFRSKTQFILICRDCINKNQVFLRWYNSNLNKEKKVNITNLGQDIKKEGNPFKEDGTVDLEEISDYFLIFKNEHGKMSIINKSDSGEDKMFLLWHAFLLILQIIAESSKIDNKYFKISSLALIIIESLSESGINTYYELNNNTPEEE